MSEGNGTNGGAPPPAASRMPAETGTSNVQRPTPTAQRRESMVRVLPHSVEAEQGVLGSMLISPREIIAEAMGKISADHFYVPRHQMIYLVLTELYDRGLGIDLITFTQVLRDRDVLETVGGASFVTSLFTFVPTAANIAYYLDILRDKFVRRQIIATCTELVVAGYDETNEETNVVLDAAQARLTGLSINSAGEEPLRHISAGVSAVLEKFENAYSNRGSDVITGLATGFHDLDRVLSGMKPQQYITIAGLTSHGKTAVAANIAEHVALEQGAAVGLWSMEMSYDEMCERLVCQSAGVSLQRLRDGFLKDEHFAAITPRAGRLIASRFYVDDRRGLSINDFKASARRAVQRHGLQLLIVDYLQLMNSPTKRGQENRAREIAEITGGLKSVAKEMGIPVIGLAQLSREADKRAAVFRRPKLSDLKESSSIEQDSDVVIFVWRPDRFVETDEDRQKLGDRLKLKELNDKTRERCRRMEEIDGEMIPYTEVSVENYAELIVAKQRNGPVTSETNRIVLRFESDLTRFENLTPKMWSNAALERQG